MFLKGRTKEGGRGERYIDYLEMFRSEEDEIAGISFNIRLVAVVDFSIMDAVILI